MAEHHEHHEHHVHHPHKEKKSKWMYSTIILVILLSISIGYAALFMGNPMTRVTMNSACLESAGVDQATIEPCLTVIGGVQTQIVDINQAANDAISYLNDNVVQPGTTASVAGTEDLGSVYEVTTAYQGQNIPIYVSKDGTFLCLQGIDMSETVETTTPTTVAVEKVEKPVANAFIMSYCPYGLQFLKAYVPVIELLGDKADITINFVPYIMHSDKELEENNRIYCIQKEQNDKLTDYLRCFVEEGDHEGCIASVGIDADALDACIAAADTEFEITKTYEESTETYPPYLVDSVLANQYGVRGSPTFVLNGVVTSVSRSAEAIKQAICSSFITPPAECDTTLSSSAESAGLGPIGSGSGSGSSGTC